MFRPLKKLLALLLVLMSASTALAALMVPATPEQISEALDCLQHCAFAPEYGTAHNALLRWNEPLVIRVDGDYTAEDIATLDRFIDQLNEYVPHMPPVSRTVWGDANITMWFGPLAELAGHIDDYTPGNWGYAYYYYYTATHEIHQGQVVIATDVTNQRERSHLIQEELMCILGLTNDHYCREDSIIYQPWTDVQSPNDIDWIMLQMIYDPAVSPGMGPTETLRTLRQKY